MLFKHLGVLMKRIPLIFVALLTLLAVLWTACSTLPAYAHNAKSGWPYPPGCCSQPEKECHEVPASTIVGTRYDAFGKLIIIMKFKPGDHPNITREMTFERVATWFQQSGDSEHHACINPLGTAIYCYFWQAGG